MPQAKQTQPQCGIKVYRDGSSLALRFPVKYNPIFEQLDGKAVKKQKCLGLGLKDNPSDWKRAIQIAIDIENDLEHKDWLKLFDPTLGKYGIGNTKYKDKLADVIQLPTYVAEMTVGEMWEDYLIWKEPQLQPTTFQRMFKKVYTNALKGLKWDSVQKKYIQLETAIWISRLSPAIGEQVQFLNICDENKARLSQSLNEAFIRAQSLGKVQLKTNPFFELGKKVGDNTKEKKYKSTLNKDGEILEWWQIQDAETDEQERDRRAFSKEERDIIIKAFYESKHKNKRQIAPLIEFLFLTGCRPGEAFALRWQDVILERGYIRFSKSYNQALKTTQQTKTGEIRMFKVYRKLAELLLRIKPENAAGTDLVFKQEHGSPYNSNTHGRVWYGREAVINDTPYLYPGVVTELVKQGAVSGYLPPYNARHTFISLMAHAGTDLLLLATACGNSVEIIQKHYLGVNTEASFPDI